MGLASVVAFHLPSCFELHAMVAFTGRFNMAALQLVEMDNAIFCRFSVPNTGCCANVTESRDYPITKYTACPTATCKDRCGKRAKMSFDIPCSCDDRCAKFNDCCQDYDQVCNRSNTSQNVTTGQPSDDWGAQFSCQGQPCYSCIFVKFFDKPKLLISRCKDLLPDSHQLVRKCERPSRTSIVENVPIFHRDRGDFYRNIYCVLCHNISVGDVAPFQPVISCPTLSVAEGKRLQKLPFSRITLSDIKECSVILKPSPDQTWTSRECITMDIHQCEAQPECSSFLDPREIKLNSSDKSLIVRNRFCLQCLSSAVKQERCWGSGNSHRKGFQIDESDKVSFSLLFDLSRFESSIEQETVSNYIKDSSIQTMSNLESHFGQDFDVFHAQVYLLANDSLLSQTFEQLKVNVLREEFPRLINLTLLTGYFGSCGHLKMNSEVKIECSLIEPNVTITEAVELFDNFLNSLVSILGQTVCGATMSRLQHPMDIACLTNVEVYTGSLDALTYAKNPLVCDPLRGAAVVPGNRTENCRVPWPLEIQWSPSRAEETDMGGGIPVYAREVRVCGNSAENYCTLTSYAIQDILNYTSLQNLSQIDIPTLIVVEDEVWVCAEELQEFLLRSGRQTADKIEFYITVIGSSLSLSGLASTFLVYSCFEELQNLPGKCIINLVLSIFVAQSLLLIGGIVTSMNDYACQAIAVAQHVFWLASFSWTNVLAYDLSRVFGICHPLSSRDHSGCRFLLYSLAGWSVPLVVVAVCVCLNYTKAVDMGYGRESICWIGNWYALVFGFIVPVSVHLLINVIAYCFIVSSIYRIGKLAKEVKLVKDRQRRAGVYARVSSIMGFTWIVGFLANLFPVKAVWYTFSLLNSTQGIYIFIAFVCTSKVVGLFRQRHHKSATSNTQLTLTAISERI